MPLLQLDLDERKKLASRLCYEIEASNTAKGKLPERWARNRAIYAVEEVSTLEVVEGAEPYNIPLYRQKADRVVDHQVEAFAGRAPYVQVISDGKTEGYERALTFLADQASYKRTLRRMVVELLNTDIGACRVRPIVEDNRLIGIESERIKAEFLVAYPCYFTDFEKCTTIGHKVLQPMRDVLQKIKAGTYYKDAKVSRSEATEFEDSSGEHPVTAVDSYVAEKDEDSMEPVDTYEVITEYKVGGNWKMILCTVAYSDRELLSAQDYPYPIDWYVVGRLDDEDDVIWPSHSLAQRMQGLNNAFSDMLTILSQGSVAAAFPVLITKGLLGKEKVMRWRAGQRLDLPTGAEAEMLGTPFNPAAIPLAMEKVEQIADAVMGVSRLGSGQGLPSDTREKAIEGILNSDAEAKAGYSSSIVPIVKKFFTLIDLYLVENFNEIKAIYQEKLPIDDIESIPLDYEIKVSGENSSASPQETLRKLSFAMELARDPNSGLSYQKTEQKVMDELELPFSPKTLGKDEIDLLLMLISRMNQMGIDGAGIAIQAILESQQGANDTETEGGIPPEQPMGMGEEQVQPLQG